MNYSYDEISPGHAKPSRSLRQEINSTDKQMQNPLILRASHWNGRALEIDRWASGGPSYHYDALPTVSFRGGRTLSDDSVVNCYNSHVSPSTKRTNQLDSVCQSSLEKQSLTQFNPQLPCNFNGDLKEIKEQKSGSYLNSHEQCSAWWQLHSKNPGNIRHCSSQVVCNHRASHFAENRCATTRPDPVTLNVGYPRFRERIAVPYIVPGNSSGYEINQGILPGPVNSCFNYSSCDKEGHFLENSRVGSVPSLTSLTFGKCQNLQSTGETRHPVYNNFYESCSSRSRIPNATVKAYPTAVRFESSNTVPHQLLAPGRTLPFSGSGPYSYFNAQAPLTRANAFQGQQEYRYPAQSAKPRNLNATFRHPSPDNVNSFNQGAQQYVSSSIPAQLPYTFAQGTLTNEASSILQTQPRGTFLPQSPCVPHSAYRWPGTPSPWQGYPLSQHSPCAHLSAGPDASTLVNRNLIYNPVTIGRVQTSPRVTNSAPQSKSPPQLFSNPNGFFGVQSTKGQPGISPMGQNLQGVGPENELPQSFLNSFNNLGNFSPGDASGPTENGTPTRREPGTSDGSGPSLLEKTELLKEKIVSAFAQAADGGNQQASGSSQGTPSKSEGKERRMSANGRRLHRSNTYDGSTWSSMKDKHRTGSLRTDSADKRSPMTNFGNHRTLSQRQHSVIVCTAVIPLPAPASKTVSAASNSTTHSQLAYTLSNPETGNRHLACTGAELGQPNVNHIGDLTALNNPSQQHSDLERKKHGGLESFPIEDIAGGRSNLVSNPNMQNVPPYYHTDVFSTQYALPSATTLPPAASILPSTGHISYARTGGSPGSLRRNDNTASFSPGVAQPPYAETTMWKSGPANLYTSQTSGPSCSLNDQSGSRMPTTLGTNGEAHNWLMSQTMAANHPPSSSYSYHGPQGPGLQPVYSPIYFLDSARAQPASLQSCVVPNFIPQANITPSQSLGTRSSGMCHVQGAHTAGTPSGHSITPDIAASHIPTMDGTAIMHPSYPVDARSIYERGVTITPQFTSSFPGSPERVGVATSSPACLIDSQGHYRSILDHRGTVGQPEAVKSCTGPPYPPPGEFVGLAHQVQGHNPTQGDGSLGSTFPLSTSAHTTDHFTGTKIHRADSQVDRRKVEVAADGASLQAAASQRSHQGGHQEGEEAEHCASHSQPVLLMSSSWPSSSFPVLIKDPRVKIPEVEAYSSSIPAILEQLQQRTDGSFSQLLSIAVKLQDMEEDILKFTGKHGDQEYIYLEEMLTRQLLALDQVLADGDEEIRTSRRSLVKEVQELLEILDRRAKA